MMLCFGMTPMNINATEEEVYATKYETHEKVDLRAVYVTCPSCAAAAKKSTEYSGWIYDEKVPCTHGKSGYDFKFHQNVKATITCSNCGYTKTQNSTQHKIECGVA